MGNVRLRWVGGVSHPQDHLRQLGELGHGYYVTRNPVVGKE